MHTILIACGGNAVNVPCRIFSNEAEGQAFLDLLLTLDPTAKRKVDRIRFQDDLPESVTDLIFTQYYGGCGGAYTFVLESVPTDTKFINWNLD